MDPQVQSALIAGAAGVVTGAIGSLFAPWSKWGVDKRRLRYGRRTKLIDEWRDGLTEAERMGSLGKYLYDNPWYLSLRAQDRPKRLAKLRRWMKRHKPKRFQKPSPPPPSRSLVITVGGAVRDGEAVEIEGQINRLARKWRIH